MSSKSVSIVVPSLGESVSDAVLAQWCKKPGEAVQADDLMAELETDKITLEILAPCAGTLAKIQANDGDTVTVGQTIGTLDPSNTSAGAAPSPTAPTPKPETKTMAPADDLRDDEERRPMSRLRQKVAANLKEAQNTAAILTTFNEVDMGAVMDLRQRYRASFEATHGIRLGFMSFFVRATVLALQEFPMVNAEIQGHEVVYKNHYDIGVAIGIDQGLVVPVVRHAEKLSFAAIEKDIQSLSDKAKNRKLLPDDLMGATFTISNGGVYGSLLSTPILNSPQSGILGLHSIQKRPVVQDDQIVIRPMMYMALSYDHRLIDGREAVSFLKSIKETIENPTRLLLGL